MLITHTRKIKRYVHWLIYIEIRLIDSSEKYNIGHSLTVTKANEHNATDANTTWT
jgi:hypothetical protein